MNPMPNRRRMMLGTLVSLAAGAAVGGLGGCASPAPPPRLYRLAIEPPAGQPLPAAPGSAEVWQLVQPVHLPEYLQRDAVLLPQGRSGLQALAGHRWAEPLSDAVSRILLNDLTLLRGSGRVWGWPLPQGVVVARQLRVELLAFEVDDARRALHLRARWTLVDASGAQPPRSGRIELDAASGGSDVQALVAAHRLALWQLAERLAAL